MSDKFLRGVIIAFVAVGALFVMIGPLGLSPRKAKFFAVGICVVLWQSSFLKSKKRSFPAKKEEPVQNSRNNSAEKSTISIYPYSNRSSNFKDNATRTNAKIQNSKRPIAAKKNHNVATKKSRTYFKIRISLILCLGLIAIVYTAKLALKLNREWWLHSTWWWPQEYQSDPPEWLGTTLTDGFLGNIPPHELLKQIYEYDQHTYNTFQDLGNRHEDSRPALPYKVYLIALHEAHLPKYDIFRRAGWTEDEIVNKLANELYVPLVYLVKEGRGWTNHTDLSEEEWKRFDQIMENRFTASLSN